MSPINAKFVATSKLSLETVAERVAFLEPELKITLSRIEILETLSHANAQKVCQLWDKASLAQDGNSLCCAMWQSKRDEERAQAKRKRLLSK